MVLEVIKDFNLQEQNKIEILLGTMICLKKKSSTI